MMSGKIVTKAKAFHIWFKEAGTNQTEFCKEIGFDQGNFSKMLRGDLEPSKSFIKKSMIRTGLPFDSLFSFERFLRKK